jgi:hypothetical protein
MFVLGILLVLIHTFNFVYGVLFPIAMRLPLLGEPPLPGAAIWPKPNKVEQTKSYYFINKDSFKIYASTTKTNNCEREIINQRIGYYLNILFPPKLAYEYPSIIEKQMNTLKIEIQNSKPNSNNCKSDYYPLITDTNQEYCK